PRVIATVGAYPKNIKFNPVTAVILNVGSKLKKPMKYIKILLLFIIIYSCKTDSKTELQTDSDRNDTFAMYGLLMEEFNYSNGILREQLTENLTDKKFNEIHSVKIYDSLTKQYLNLLDQTYSELINSANLQDQSNYFGELSKKNYVNDYFF